MVSRLLIKKTLSGYQNQRLCLVGTVQTPIFYIFRPLAQSLKMANRPQMAVRRPILLRR